MDSYDASKAPGPEEWLSIDEDERLILVEKHHEELTEPHPEFGSATAHASFHVLIENQIAMGDETPVRDAINRLMGEGLTRHEAVHAAASVCSANIYDGWKTRSKTGEQIGEAYFKELETFTAKEWYRRFEKVEDKEDRGARPSPQRRTGVRNSKRRRKRKR